MSNRVLSEDHDAIGGDVDEVVFASFTSAEYHLGGGDDTVWFDARNIANFEIVYEGDTTKVFDNENTWLLTGVETIRFIDAEINVVYEKAALRAESDGPLHTFVETEFSEAYTYVGQFNEAQLIVHFTDVALTFDLNSDGFDDAIIPLIGGYKSGNDTRAHFQVFEGGPDGLRFSEELTNQMPFISGARRIEEIEIASVGKTAFVTVGTDTTRENESSFDIPWRMGDLSVILPEPDLNIANEIVPDTGFGQLPALTGRKTAVDAHSMAVGDYDNDGLEDILIGDSTGPFVLRQTLSGPWEVINSPFLDGFHKGVFEPISGRADGGFLLDLHMDDFNGDGADDIVAGWGDLRTASRVYLNDGQGSFSEDRRIDLPQSVYGENALHLVTYSEDFDRDGDQDLVILYSRNEPYYSGTYLQYLQNDGDGNFVDQSAARFGEALPDGIRFPDERGLGSKWHVADLNGDGAQDFIGEDLEHAKNIIALINDGTGHFDRHDVPVASEDGSSVLVAGDFDNDSKFEFVSFRAIPREDGFSSINTFFSNELSTFDFSGSSSATDPPGNPEDGTDAPDVFKGTNEADEFAGGKGGDTVSGGGGDDTLSGDSGNDVLYGGGGDDRLRGNRGEDTLKGGGGDDNIKGGGGGDVIRGNGGSDVIRAGGGDDNVKGGGGNDLILGGGGTDRLNGGGGADTLKGNGGDDTLKGNGGQDVFQFRTNDRNDTILDFRQGQDKIEIQNGANSFDALRIEQDGRDVLIGFGVAGQVRVMTDNAAAFDESDFIF